MSEFRIESVDLTKNKIKEPYNAYRIGEGRYGIARYSSDRPYLITCGLSACKGIAFVNEGARSALLGHLSVVNDVERVIAGLVRQFSRSLSQVDTYLVFGFDQGTNAKIGPWEGNWPTMEDLIREVSKHNPRRLVVDDQQYTGIRGIAVDLENRDLKEIDGSNGWTWSNQHDTSLNRWINELDK